MLQPARRKYRKEQKGRNTGIATRGNSVAFGDFGLKSTDRGRLTARQIESARRAISRHVKRGGRRPAGTNAAPSDGSDKPAEAADAPKTTVKRVRKVAAPAATGTAADGQGE